MVDFEYLYKGLCALARSHHINTMSGHLGAALVAGYFTAEQNPDLDERVYEGIESDLDRILSGQSVFSPKADAALTVDEMFEPFANEDSQVDLIEGIAEALARNCETTRQSGHNVIFASLAIRALKDHPDFTTPSITDGIRKLIVKFDRVTPGNGYYGERLGRIDGRQVKLEDDDDFPLYEDLPSMAMAVARELIEHAAERRQGFGGLHHIVNHAAAIAELSSYGFRELAIRALAGHHHHMRLWKTLPDVSDELGSPVAAEHDVRTAAFWNSGGIRYDSALLTHRVKTLYGFDALVDLIEDPDVRAQANEKLRYLM